MENYNQNEITAVIAIGGRGTRLKSITKDIPKPLFPIDRISPLRRICKQVEEYGIREVFLTLGYGSEMFEEEIKKINLQFNLKIRTFKEEIPLGECGALWQIKKFLNKQVLFINGDIVFAIDLNRFIGFHKRINSRLTLLTHTTTHPEDSDLISAPNGTLIKKLILKTEKNHQRSTAYLGNAGITLFDSDLLNIVPAPKLNENSSLLSHFVFKAYSEKILIYSYNTSEYIKDMGTKKRFFQVENDLKKGIIDEKCYRNLQRALFIDRDNTLIKCDHNSYVIGTEGLKFINYNIDKIAKISKDFHMVCLVTNQPQISMGILTIEKLDQINSLVVKNCLNHNLKIDIISFCPHHPHSGFNNEIDILKTDCFCRKPNPGMLIELSYTRNINLKESLFIGDSKRDEQAAKNAGCNFLNVDNL